MQQATDYNRVRFRAFVKGLPVEQVDRANNNAPTGKYDLSLMVINDDLSTADVVFGFLEPGKMGMPPLSFFKGIDPESGAMQKVEVLCSIAQEAKVMMSDKKGTRYPGKSWSLRIVSISPFAATPAKKA